MFICPMQRLRMDISHTTGRGLDRVTEAMALWGSMLEDWR